MATTNEERKNGTSVLSLSSDEDDSTVRTVNYFYRTVPAVPYVFLHTVRPAVCV